MSHGGPVGPREVCYARCVKSWVRSQRAAAVDVGDRVVLVGGDGVVRAIEGDSAALARAVLGYVDVARTLDAIVEHVEAQTGEPGARAIVEQLVEVLRASGAISGVDVAANDDTARGAGMRRRGNVVVGISGAVAASHAPAFVAALQRRGWTVEVALTPTAQRFVASDALAALVRRAPHISMWPDAPHAPVPHVALAEWADLVVVYPASATTIARLAAARFSDVVAATALDGARAGRRRAVDERRDARGGGRAAQPRAAARGRLRDRPRRAGVRGGRRAGGADGERRRGAGARRGRGDDRRAARRGRA